NACRLARNPQRRKNDAAVRIGAGAPCVPAHTCHVSRSLIRGRLDTRDACCRQANAYCCNMPVGRHLFSMNPQAPIASAARSMHFRFPVEGMTCASCVARVEKALGRVPGVMEANVNLATESATVELQPGSGTGAAVRAIENAGYRVPRSSVRLQIGGMTCASCIARVEKALSAVPGVESASVNLATERA